MRLGALFSGGKDSTYALFKAAESGDNEIACLIAMKSANPESYMFHIPAIELIEKQAEALDIPLILAETKGEKELELKDLKKAIKTAKDKYKIEGIVTGAVASNYQASRIQKICDELDLECINPLWGIDQEEYMREVIREGFKFILTQVAAEGLNKNWLGKAMANEDVDKLVEINKKIGINIAFEGGEAETSMIDGPIFKSKIIIKKAEIIMENECTGLYKIIEAELE